MMKRKTPKKKSNLKKIQVDGQSHNVPEIVANALDIMSNALRSHEVALLTWVHKVYRRRKYTKKTKIEKQLYDYCLHIPDSEKIIERMTKLDEAYKEGKIKIPNKETEITK